MEGEFVEVFLEICVVCLSVGMILVYFALLAKHLSILSPQQLDT